MPGPCSHPKGGKTKAVAQPPFRGEPSGEGKYLRKARIRLNARIKDYEATVRNVKSGNTSGYRKPGSLNLWNN